MIIRITHSQPWGPHFNRPELQPVIKNNSQRQRNIRYAPSN